MLERIHIENYKCLRDVTVELGDFTILIGPNDSGKSSFLEVIQTVGKLVAQGYAATFKDGHSLNNLAWERDSGLHIVMQLEGTTPEHRFNYRLEIPTEGSPPCETLEWDGAKVLWTEQLGSSQSAPQQQTYPGATLVVVVPQGQGREQRRSQLPPGTNGLQTLLQQRHSTYLGIADELKSSVEYHFEPEKLPKAAVPTPKVELHPSGQNLAAVLDVMQNSPDRSAFEAIQRALHQEIPTLAGIVLPPAAQPPGAKAIEFVLSRSGRQRVTIPGSLASDRGAPSHRVSDAGLLGNTGSTPDRRA